MSTVRMRDPSGTFDFPPNICPDNYFNWHTKHDLIWLPSIGMGWLRVEPDPLDVYDAKYFGKYLGYAATEQGHLITNARTSLVQKYSDESDVLIDIGIGCGDFLSMWSDGALGFDINPTAIRWLVARDRFADPYKSEADVLTFWDSMEHIPDVQRMIAHARRWVFCSLPIVPGDGPPAPDWKHYRPDEHCWYWNRAGLIRWMDAQGFDCVECNAMESLLGRQDIESFAFRRRDA